MDIPSQQITLILIGSFFFITVAVGIIVLFLVYQKKQLQLIIEKQQLENQFDQELLSAKLEVQESTLNHLSQELHDNIGQVLSLVKLNLNRAIGEGNASQETIYNTKELVQKAILDLRTFSKTLNTGFLARIPLSESLKFNIALIEQTGLCKTQLVVSGEESDFEEKKKLIVFRIGQELLNNAMKHSKASLIRVLISYFKNKLQIEVIDNGIGIALRSNNQLKGTGLINLSNRTKLIGGTFSIGDGDDGGTRAVITVPI